MSPRLHLASAPSRAGREPIRVLLADDRDVVRRSLRTLLGDEPGMNVIGEAGDLESAERHLRTVRSHVIVLDLQLSGGSGLELIRRIHYYAPNTGIVVLTMQPSSAFAREAIAAGASAYVLKERADSDLAEAIRAAAQGAEYFSPPVAEGVGALRRSLGEAGLTSRETEILKLIALGHTSAEIVTMAHLSRRTVESYRTRIADKIDCHSRAEVVAYALGHELLG